jgi:cytochrome c oxidase cbb3-type subunit 3
MRICLLLWAALVCAQQVHNQNDEDIKNPYARQPEALQEGQKLFRSACSGCHGASGEGGRGPNLTRGRQVRGASDRHLFASIKSGVPGTDMPPFPFPDEKIWQLVTFVRSLSAPAYESNVAGDPGKGKAIFYGKGDCSRCHMIRGRGGFLGPDLSDIGIAVTASQLREEVLEPSKRIAPGYQGVTVITRDGRKISGVGRDNTNYAIQVQDAQGGLHLLDKRDLREVVVHERSLMPGDYKQRLTEAEFQDLLAFLSRQAVRPPIERRDKESRR